VRQLLGLVADDGDGPVHVLAVGDGNVHHRARPAAGLVAHRLDLAVGDRVQGAVEIAEHHDPERDLLDHPALPRRLDHVAQGELVLHQHEEAGDDVLHQALRAEGDGEADDGGAAQERPDVDEDVEAEQDGDGEDGDPPRAPEQLRDRLPALLPDRRDGVVVVHPLLDPPRGETHEPEREPREEPDADELGGAAEHRRAVHHEDLLQAGDESGGGADEKQGGSGAGAGRVGALT
jgi:hypothetical protein